MYRIELSPGEETAFRSIEELAVAIRRGVVTPRARIYHNATNKWLPIQFHPHYKIAVTMPLTQADLVAGPPMKHREALTLSETSLQATARPKQPANPLTPSSARDSAVQAALAAWSPAKPLTSVTPPKPAEPKAPISIPAVQAIPPEPPREKRSSKGRRTKRALRLALAGALLIASTQLVIGPAGELKLAAFPGIAGLASDLPNGPRILYRSKTPARNSAAKHEATAPSLNRGVPQPAKSLPAAGPATSAAESQAIVPPPSAIEISVPTIVRSESLGPTIVDSSSKKAIKRILRAITGSPAQESAKTKR